MKFARTVTYEFEADSLEEALELWAENGPNECGADFAVTEDPMDEVEEEFPHELRPVPPLDPEPFL